MARKPPRRPAAIPYRSATVRTVLTSTLLTPLGVALISPALPTIRDAFGLTDARASLLISMYFVTGIFLSPFLGMLVDRVGGRRVLVPSLVVFGPVLFAVIGVRFGYRPLLLAAGAVAIVAGGLAGWVTLASETDVAPSAS